MDDYYKVLGVSKDSDIKEIKRAYRKLAGEHHPDKNKSSDDKRFKEINEAYSVLSDPQKRASYDRFGNADFANQQGGPGGGYSYGGATGGQQAGGFRYESSSANFGGFEDIFSDLFGGGFASGQSGGGRAGRSSTPDLSGDDMEIYINVDLADVVFGIEKQLSFYAMVKCTICKGTGSSTGSTETCSVCKGSGHVRKISQSFFGNVAVDEACSTCSGTGKIIKDKCRTCSGTGRIKQLKKMTIKIPKGANDESVLKFQGEGGAGVNGGVSGDLYIHIKVNPDSRFKRDGNNLKVVSHINITTAVLGGILDVDTLTGPIKLKIPQGTQSGEIFRVKQKGVPYLHGRGVGDLYVTVKVDIPKRLSSDEKKLFETLRTLV
ncbi:MAG: molecular chaperone DnaJ [Patescibacteria group bacterium]